MKTLELPKLKFPDLLKILIIFIFAALISPFDALSQTENMGIGESTNPSYPDNSALLDLDVSNMATKRGLLIPRMSGAERDAISSPATGLIIYNTDDNSFYYNEGTPAVPNWLALVSSAYNIPFSDLSSGTNTTAAMVVGDGASLAPGGTGTITANAYSGILPIVNGGTNLSTIPTDGQLLIGDGAGYQLAQLTEGSNVSITNAAGSITIGVSGLESPLTFENGLTRAVDNIKLGGSLTEATAITLGANNFSLSQNGDTGDLIFGKFTTAGIIKNDASGVLSSALLTDADIPDDITATSYLPLAGGTMTGNIDFTGAETVDGIDISSHAADADAHHNILHSMTSATDHTAGNWQIFYSDGTGQVAELALGGSGTVLQSNGAAIAPTWESVTIPSGASDQTLRHSGAGWEASSLLVNTSTNVGIGASSPVSRLVVEGIDATDANSALNITDSSPASLFYVRNDGFIGIGVTAPSSTYTFEVNGSTRIDGDLQVTGEIDPISLTLQPQTTAPATGKGKLYFDENDDELKLYNGVSWISVSKQLSTGTDGQTLRHDGSDWVATGNIFNNGTNIGLGTSIPNEKVTIEGAVSLDELSTKPTASPGYGKVYSKDSDSQLWYQDDSGEETQISYEYALFEDRKGPGTSGGAFTEGDWRTRDLNTDVDSRGSSISLNTGTGEITLDAGTYRIAGSAPAYSVNSHKLRLRQTSGTPVTVIYGTSEIARDANNAQSRSFVDGYITVSSDDTVFELQHICETTNATDGFGHASNLGESEIFTRIYIQRVK